MPAGPAPSAATSSRSNDRTPLSFGPLGGIAQSSRISSFTWLADGPSIETAGPRGVRLSATGRWLAPLLVASGGSTGCYASELVTTTARFGAESVKSIAVAATAPLSPSGLEVLSSGARAISPRRDFWWATIATGAGVAKVAAEQPDGTTEITRPRGGIALVGGVVRAAEVSAFFSVVAETASGRSLHSIGFLTGWGPRTAGAATGPAAGSSASTGCARGLAGGAPRVGAAASANTSGTPGSSGTSPSVTRSVLRAAAGVVAGLCRAHAPAAVTVIEVRVLSPASAEAVYRLGGGSLRTGRAVLSRSGLWEVS